MNAPLFFVLLLSISTLGFANSADHEDKSPTAAHIKPELSGHQDLSTLDAVNPILLNYEAKYQAEWKGGWIPITVDAKRSFIQQENGNWILQFEVFSSLADLSERSTLQFSNNSLTPLKYEYETSGLLSSEVRTQEFRWKEKKVWGAHKSQYWKYELPKNTQDSISYQEQLRFDLQQGKTKFSYPVSYKHKLKTYEFEIVGNTTLKTPSGPIETIEVRQLINKSNKLKTHMWFAKDFHWIMVRLKQKRPNGDKQEVTLHSATVNGDTLKAYTD